MKTLIAVDPGVSGGIAWIIQPGNGTAQAIPIPETRGDTITMLRGIVGNHPENCTAYIEKISGFIPDGGASQMFQFGAAVERPGCILETLGVRIIEITPQAWQKGLGLGNSERVKVPSAPRGATKEEKAAFKREHAAEIATVKSHNDGAKRDWKRKLKSEAQRRFPAIRTTLKNSDCLLILDVAQQMEGIKPPHMELAATIPIPIPTKAENHFTPQESTSPFDTEP